MQRVVVGVSILVLEQCAACRVAWLFDMACMYVCMCASFCADFCAFVAPKHGVDYERIAVLAVANNSVTSSS